VKKNIYLILGILGIIILFSSIFIGDSILNSLRFTENKSNSERANLGWRDFFSRESSLREVAGTNVSIEQTVLLASITEDLELENVQYTMMVNDEKVPKTKYKRLPVGSKPQSLLLDPNLRIQRESPDKTKTAYTSRSRDSYGALIVKQGATEKVILPGTDYRSFISMVDGLPYLEDYRMMFISNELLLIELPNLQIKKCSTFFYDDYEKCRFEYSSLNGKISYTYGTEIVKSNYEYEIGAFDSVDITINYLQQNSLVLLNIDSNQWSHIGTGRLVIDK
jgi:hypothetical protein